MPEERIEEETYSLIFKSLKHPIRRKILRILVGKCLSFSEILDILSIDSGHLSYHIENLGDLVRHSADGKYELSSIGTAAVDLMTGVEERPQLLTPIEEMRRKKTRNVLIGTILIILVASVALNAYFFNSSQVYFNSLQETLKENRNGSGVIAREFRHSVWKATGIDYLLSEYVPTHSLKYVIFKYGGKEALYRYTYNVTYDGNGANEDNIEPLIKGFLNEMQYAWRFLAGLIALNPELHEYEEPIYCIYMFTTYTFVVPHSRTDGPNVLSVLESLLEQARSAPSSWNYSIPLTAFKELNQTSFQKMREMSFEVGESFFSKGVNATRLESAVNKVEELEVILGVWIDKYSQM